MKFEIFGLRGVIADQLAFALFTWLSFIVFLDRGIIPGSTVEFNGFIVNVTGSDRPDVQLGLLQSSFIIGLMSGSLLFGHLVASHNRFLLTGIGMSVWIAAVFMSGTSYFAQNYSFLLFSRILSGFGEACLFCAIPPWIQHTAPVASQGIWLGIFYTTVPVGTACGYAYSASISASLGWQYAFFIEILFVVPFLPVLFGMEDARQRSELRRLATSEDAVDTEVDQSDEIEGSPPTTVPVWHALLEVLNSPCFVCLCLGSAAQSAVLVGLSTFGSAFLLGLGFYNTEAAASAIFGILVSLAGMVATPLGGILTDRLNNRNTTTELGTTIHTSKVLLLQQLSLFLYWASLLATILFAVCFFSTQRAVFLALISLGAASCFATNAGWALALLVSVRKDVQSFALAVSSVVMHLCGDVPAPVFVGWMKDNLATACSHSGGGTDAAQTAASPDCRAQSTGLRWTLLVTSLWMYVAVICFSVAWFVAQFETWSDLRTAIFSEKKKPKNSKGKKKRIQRRTDTAGAEGIQLT